MVLRSRALVLLIAVLVLSIFSALPSLMYVNKANASDPASWNLNVGCTPLVIRISDITANQTGYSSFDASRFSPGITTSLPLGEAKRWLTAGPTTPANWVPPGPACTVTNSDGTISLFVQINGLKRSNLVDEDFGTTYDPTNGGTSHQSTTDTTFNLYDPSIVHKYSTSCESATDSTCHGIIHAEIDHDWKAAGYCGTGTPCDGSALASQTNSTSTIIDVQGFVFWDPGHVNEAWHQFNGWEIHPLTAWRLSNTTQPGSVSFSWSPFNPQVGQATIFTANVSNGTLPSSFNWDFGDGVSAFGQTVYHIYVTPQAFNVEVNMTDVEGNSVEIQRAVTVGSWNPTASCAPYPTSLESVIGNATILRDATNPNSTGADYSGGGFKLDGNLPYGSNPTTWPFFKRDLQPPCSLLGTSSFVEFHNVTVTDINVDDCSTAYASDNGGGPYPHGWQSCDTTFNLVTPGFGDSSTCPSCYMHRVYAGIDRDWNASGVAPLPRPREGQRIDVQGFVYWNNNFINAPWHSYTGWEIHPLTAWRPARRQVSVNASITPSNPAPGQLVTFTGSAFGGTLHYNFTWDFGDGTIAVGNPVSHAYASGIYIVHLAATDSVGTSGVASQTINVKIPPDFSISIDPGSLTFPALSSTTATVDLFSKGGFGGNVSLSVIVSTKVTASLNPFLLLLSAGSSAGSTLTLSSATPGDYNVTVTGTSGPFSHSASLIVRVADLGPAISFTESASNAFRHETIIMTISSSDRDGTVTSLAVDWGDGTIDILPGNATTDSHAYIFAGTFRVNVTATDNGGLGASATRVNTITDAPPTVSFTITSSSANTGQTVTLAISSVDSDGTITETIVNWGDGTIHTFGGAVASDVHAFVNTGNAPTQTFTISVRVTDNATLTGNSSANFSVNDLPPTVSFTTSTSSAYTGVPISFNATLSTDPDGIITSYAWSFGDSGTGTGATETHTYSGAGNYAVMLMATDNSGNQANVTITIMILDRPPVASFVSNATSSQTLTTIGFDASASFDPDGTIVGYAWNFGDGTTASGITVTHSYAKAGNYLVVLAVTDNNGVASMIQTTETIINRPPAASFTFVPSNPLAGQSISFDGSSSSDPDGAVLGFAWSFGDGTSSSGATVQHAYATNGTFTISLTVTDDNGGKGTTIATMTVGYDPAPEWLVGGWLNATHISFRSLTLAWAPAHDNVQVSGYKLYVNGSLLVALPGYVTSYNVNGLNPLEHYVFQVQAGNPSSNWSADGPSVLIFADLQADLNHDCTVDIVDMVLVASSFGSGSGDSGYNVKVDLNNDGRIDIVDLVLVAGSFGQTC